MKALFKTLSGGSGGIGELHKGRWGRYKKRASPRRIKSRPFIHCLLTPKKLNSRMSSASRSAAYSIDGKLSK